MNFDKIKEARKNAGMTQEELATALGVNRATISKYESGLIEPSIKQVQAIATALGVSASYLLYNGSIRITPPEHSSDEAGLNAVRSLGQSLNQLTNMTAEAFGLDLDILVTRYHILNAEGKREAMKRIQELARLPEYTKPDEEKTPPEATGAATEDE